MVIVTAVSQETKRPYTTAIQSFHLSGRGLLAMLDLPPEGLLVLAGPGNLLGGSLPLLDSSELEMSSVSDHLGGECCLTPVIVCWSEHGLRQYLVLASGYTRLYLRDPM